MLRPPGYCHGSYGVADAYYDPESEDGNERRAHCMGHVSVWNSVAADESDRREDGGSFQ